MLVLDEALYYSVPRTTIRILFFAFLVFFFLAFFFLGALLPTHASLYPLVDLSSALYLPFLVLARLGLGLTSHSCFRIKVVFLLIKFFYPNKHIFHLSYVKTDGLFSSVQAFSHPISHRINNTSVGHCTLDST